MKKIVFISILALVAAGCNNSQYSYQNQSQNQSSNAVVVVQINKLSPAIGPTGTQVKIIGQGFTKTGNLIMFGDSSGRHHPDGTADNVIAKASSEDGTTLTFEVPFSGPSGILCDQGNNHCIGIMAIRRGPGMYKVAVSNSNGVSNSVNFTIISPILNK